ARSGAALISYYLGSTLPDINPTLGLYAGDFNDTAIVTSTDPATAVYLEMGGGNDTVTVGGGPIPLAGITLRPLVRRGGRRADTIVVNDADAGINFTPGAEYRFTNETVTRNGISADLSSVSRNGHSIVYFAEDTESVALLAGSGNDTIFVEPTRAKTAVVRA